MTLHSFCFCDPILTLTGPYILALSPECCPSLHSSFISLGAVGIIAEYSLLQKAASYTAGYLGSAFLDACSISSSLSYGQMASPFYSPLSTTAFKYTSEVIKDKVRSKMHNHMWDQGHVLLWATNGYYRRESDTSILQSSIQ